LKQAALDRERERSSDGVSIAENPISEAPGFAGPLLDGYARLHHPVDDIHVRMRRKAKNLLFVGGAIVVPVLPVLWKIHICRSLLAVRKQNGAERIAACGIEQRQRLEMEPAI
jgi:hypothetical protein